MTTVRWGVLGAGGIARRRTIPEGILPARNASLAACYDADPAVNAATAETFGCDACASRDDLLSRALDAVYIATPADRHFDDALAAAAAGKHVLCEKPLGLSVDEARRMRRAFGEAGLTLGAALMMRFHAQHAAALKMLRAGRLGAPVYARAQLSCWYPPLDGAWRQDPARGGGGSLMDLGGHCIDLLEMFFGPARRVVCATNSTVHAYAAEDSAVATLFFANGALGTVDAFFCIPDASSRNRLELYGSKGSILADLTIGQGDRGEMRALLAEPDAGYDAQQTRDPQGALVLDPEPVNMYRAEVEEFSAALLEGRTPANDAAIGVRSQMLLAACYESARTGRAVDVESDHA